MSTEQPHEPEKPMKTYEDYRQLQADLEAIEKSHANLDPRSAGRLYLCDQSVDAENVEPLRQQENLSEERYWHAMYVAAGSAAGERARDYGFDINKALGYDVY